MPVALLFVLQFSLFRALESNADADVWMTSADGKNMFTHRELPYSSQVGDFTLRLDTNTKYQQMEGFGAAVTGSSAYLIRNLPAAQRTKLLTELYHPTQGIGLNYIRLAFGSSDFSVGLYTYCDTPGIANFKVPDIDKRDLFPVMREILAINPKIKILISPWSAPAWMKDSNNLLYGSMKESELGNLATYFVKFINALKSEGITVDALTCQNEPMFQSYKHPSMYMWWEQQSTFIREHLGPALQNAGLQHVKIQILDHNWDLIDYPINILNDARSAAFIAGTAFHGYGGSPSEVEKLRTAHPSKGIWFTELSGGDWDHGSTNPIPQALNYMTQTMMPMFAQHCKNYLAWNLALDPNHGPTTPGGTFCTDCRGVVTIKSDHTWTRELDYYYLAHFSRVVRDGAYRIQANVEGQKPSGITETAFVNPDGTGSIVVTNRSGKSHNITVEFNGKKVTVEAPHESATSFLLH